MHASAHHGASPSPHPLPLGEWTLEARGAEAEARITELSEELARTDAPALRRKLDESEKRCEKLESDCETTKMQLVAAHARITREQEMAMAECSLLNEGLTATREAQAQAEAEVALLREEMERVRAEERSTAQEKERLAHEKVEVMQGTMTMMGKDLHAAQEALRQARADIQGYQNTIREVANRQQSAVNEEMEELKDKLEAAQARTSTLQALLQEEKTIMLGKVEQLGQRTKEVLALEKRLQQVTAERDKRELLVTQLQAELDAGFERHGVELRDRITRLEHELDASKAVAGQTIAELSTRIEALSAEIEPAKALAASGADLVEQLRQARSDLEGARRGDKTWEVVGRLQRDMEGAKAIARGLLSEDEAGVVRPAGMCAHLEAVVLKFRQATDLLERTRIALRQATEALEHAERANRAERALLSTSAIMGLKQLSVHLTYTLSGLRIGEERPTGEPSASVLAIKQLSFSQSVPVLPSAAPSVPSRRRVWAVSGEPIPRLLMPQPPGARNLLQGRSAVQYVEKAEAKVEATIDRSGLIEYPGLMATVEQAAAADEEKAAAKGGGSPRTVGLSRNRDSVEVHSFPGSPQGSPTGSKTRFLDSPTGPNKKIISPRSKPSPTSPRGSVAVGTAALAGSVAMSGVVINGPVAGAAGLVKGPTLGGGVTIGAATGVVPLGNATGRSPSPIGARTRQEVVDEVAAAHREVRQALRAAKAVEAAMMQVLPEPLPDVHATRRMPSKPLGGGSPIKPTGISLSPPSSLPPPPSKQPKRQMQPSTATGLPALPPAACISLAIQGDPKELAVTG